MAGFSVNSENCYACKTCAIACQNEKMLPPTVQLRRVRSYDTATGCASVSMACNHCDEPACMSVCPQSCYIKDSTTGLVYQQHDLCIGCKSCITACPFGAPAFCEADSTTYKCDGCIDRQSIGLQPRCTVSCPSGNISWTDGEPTDGTPLKDQVATKPNFSVVLDKDITIETVAAVDTDPTNIDRGGEDY
ncbi:MAG: 4Fe-4S dicluster domain-containing protein [Eggerthellales bacterium]|nr:4Fe-4S dicluster domain-containing protein [Eggerthellales bacterium]